MYLWKYLCLIPFTQIILCWILPEYKTLRVSWHKLGFVYPDSRPEERNSLKWYLCPSVKFIFLLYLPSLSPPAMKRKNYIHPPPTPAQKKNIGRLWSFLKLNETRLTTSFLPLFRLSSEDRFFSFHCYNIIIIIIIVEISGRPCTCEQKPSQSEGGRENRK